VKPLQWGKAKPLTKLKGLTTRNQLRGWEMRLGSGRTGKVFKKSKRKKGHPDGVYRETRGVFKRNGKGVGGAEGKHRQ